MHSPSQFRIKDHKILIQFIKENAFASLITSANPFPLASQIPIEVVDESDVLFLYGHVSAANPQAEIFKQENVASLAIFNAGHSYVSSSWYEQENVSTWNYRSVQVKGFINPLLDEDLRSHLIRMQAKYEKEQANPRTVETMSKEYFEKQVKGVRGFSMKISSVEGSWKLSQNRNEKDFQNIIVELEKQNDPNATEIACEMKKLNLNKKS